MAITTGYTKGSDSQIIWLDNTLCHGTETRLIDCLANPLSVHNCNHMQDAGVRCEGSAMCTQGDIRLQGGTSTQGRVEICVRNTWGTVCQHNWNTADATVACKQLGFSGMATLVAATWVVFVCLFVCLFIYLFVCLFIYLFVCLFVCLVGCSYIDYL